MSNEIQRYQIDQGEKLRGRVLELLVAWGSGWCRQEFLVGTLTKGGIPITAEQFRQVADFLADKGLIKVDRGHAYWQIKATSEAVEVVQRTKDLPSGILLDDF